MGKDEQHFCIADLTVKIPTKGTLGALCRGYATVNKEIDFEIYEKLYRYGRYPEETPTEIIAYIESGYQFYRFLLKKNGLYLHASAVELDGKAYLFSAPCGTGKSTHTRMWQSVFGEEAKVFNDDKPALRRLEDGWYAYGTPWCGKDGININMKVPLAGICFLKQAEENKIRRLSMQEAAQKIIWQTLRRFDLEENLDLMLSHVDKLVREIPVFELENRPEPEAARLSYETMSQAATHLK